ncbi:MAG: hypothetical protein RLO48_09055 [Bauldia litoralis]
MMISAFRPAAAMLCCAALSFGLPAAAQAGDIAEKATLAETLLDRGYGGAALKAFDTSAAAFWTASPLQLRTVLFADAVDGFADYTPRGNSEFQPSDALRLYFEPVGFAYTDESDGFGAALAADLQIRTPGGLILATAEDFGRLEWQGRSKMREVHATIEFPLPDFKPGSYQLLLTLRDQNSPKTTTVTLPFSVTE